MKNPSFAAVAIFTCSALLSPLFAAPARGGGQIEAAQAGGLRIVVLDGEDSVNIIAQGTAVPTLVEVRDRNDLPVSGALVLFLLGDGGTATLNAGLQQVALTTNALGQAAVVVNPLATGAVELSVSAMFAGETATAAIVQTNFATVADAAAAGASATGGAGGGAEAGGAGGPEAGASAGGGLGTGALVGLAGAGAAVGVGLAVAGGGDSTPPVVIEPPARVPSRPSPPTLTAGDGQLAVSWSAPAANGAAIDDYDVQYRPSGGGNWSELGGQFLDRRATIAGLTNGTTYEVQVRAGNSAGKGAWSASATDTPVSVPARPAAPMLTVGDGQLEVSWAAPAANGAQIVDYDVQYRAGGGNWRELSDNGGYTSTRATIPDLTNGTTYEVQVRAENSAGESGWSPSARGTPMASATAPDAPSAPTVTAGDGELEVSWAAPAANGAPIVDYDVQYRAGGGNWRELSDNGGYTSTRATIPDLTNGTTYEVQVRAENSAGESGWSPSARGTPMASATAPDAPSAPIVEGGDGELHVIWSHPADNGAPIEHYELRIRPEGEDWSTVDLSDVGKTTGVSITSVSNGTTYEIQIRAVNSVGKSDWSPSGWGTPMASATVPDAPAPPTVEGGDGELEVSWAAPADNGAPIVDYDVQYRAGGGNWRELSDDGRYTNTRATLPGLTNGTTYEVQVRAENSEGESGWSPSARGTPMASATAPDAPSAPTVEGGDGELEVSWAAPADNGAPIVDYDVQYRAGGGNWRELSDNGRYTSTRVTIPDLTNGTTYEVQVRAENSEGESGWSPSSRGTPMASATAPDAPSAPTVEGGDGELEVSWAAPADNGAPIVDYDVQYRAGGGNWRELSDDGRYTNTRATLPGLTNGTTYEVQVRAENSEGESGWSPSAQGTPMASATAPDAPSAPTVEGGDGELLVSWSHPADNGAPIEHYELRIRPEGEDWSTFDLSDEGKITGVSITGVTNGTTYEVQIRAVNSAGESGWSPSGWGTPRAVTPPATVPDAPAAPSVEARDGELLVSWSHPADNGAPIEHYDLRIRSEDEEDWSTFDLSDEGKITGVSITGVTNGTTYLVQIRAWNSVGASDWSPSGWATPSPAASLEKINGLARLSVADAVAEENVDDTIDFTVTLDRPANTTVSVDYATADGSAQAGVDYIARSGTLIFSPGDRSKTVQVVILDDTHDEGEEAFTLVLSNASGGFIVDGLATGRIKNHDPLPRALLARFGRTAAVHVVEQVEERLQAPRAPGVEGRYAGQELRPGMERNLAANLLGRGAGQMGLGNGPMNGGLLGMGGVGGQPAPGVGPMGLGGPGNGPMGDGLLDMGGGDLLNGSAFAFNQETRRGGVLSFWSRGAQSSFMGREGALALDGDVRTTMFGADYAKGPVVVGLSLANSRGLGSYAGVDAGRVATSVTGLYPWLGYRVTDRVTVWGVTGYGTGGMMLTPGGGPALESGLSMAMAAGGTRGELIGGGSGGFGLAFKADAMWVGASVDGVDGPSGRLAATGTAVTRFRTGLEGSREFLLAGRISLKPSAEVGLRHDGGDAETGAGVDVGGGLMVADSSTGLALDVRMRMLVLHQADGFRERGMALSLSYDPTPSTPLGFMARVAPSWGGEATGGAEALWGRETMAGLADGGFASGNRLDTEIGYGLPVGSRFVGTPRVGFAASEYGRDYRMGYGLTLLERESLNLELGVDARRRESPMQNGADNGFIGRALLGW